MDSDFVYDELRFLGYYLDAIVLWKNAMKYQEGGVRLPKLRIHFAAVTKRGKNGRGQGGCRATVYFG
jgi:hypothetical protein